MPRIIVIGLQWGDEDKGNSTIDMTIGATEQTFRLISSGIFNSHARDYIGSGYLNGEWM